MILLLNIAKRSMLCHLIRLVCVNYLIGFCVSNVDHFLLFYFYLEIWINYIIYWMNSSVCVCVFFATANRSIFFFIHNTHSLWEIVVLWYTRKCKLCVQLFNVWRWNILFWCYGKIMFPVTTGRNKAFGLVSSFYTWRIV